jgi:ubiquinone/menaquinone biosynthesis C-methylase UbiE
MPALPDRNAVFGHLAARLDQEPLRYTAFCADRLVIQLHPAPGDKVLDVSAGTGSLTVAAAQAVRAGGRVTAIDTVESLLARLETKITKFGLTNVDVHQMDGAHLDFRRNYFHHVISSLGLFWLPNPVEALREWHRVLRPGGSVFLATFASGVFQPWLGQLLHHLERAGLRLTVPWASMSDRQVLDKMLRTAGFEDIDIADVQLGYHLADARQWWQVAEGSGLLSLIEPARSDAIESVRAAHLAQVAAAMTAEGLWLDVPVLFARGRKEATA